MQALAAAHWCAVQAAEDTAGPAGRQPWSATKCCTLAQLSLWCPPLGVSAFMATLCQKIARLPTVSTSCAVPCGPRLCTAVPRAACGPVSSPSTSAASVVTCPAAACLQGSDNQWLLKVGVYNRLAGMAAKQPRLATGLSSSGMLAMMLRDAATLHGLGDQFAAQVRGFWLLA